jgi:hypothetical protein
VALYLLRVIMALFQTTTPFMVINVLLKVLTIGSMPSSLSISTFISFLKDLIPLLHILLTFIMVLMNLLALVILLVSFVFV